MGGGRVMGKLGGVLAWAERGVTVVIPSGEALSKARTRLGPAPLRLLFEKSAGVLARPGTPGAFWRGRRLVSLDGTTLDVQDTEANWQQFGGPSTKGPSGAKLRGAFPQVRLLALAECGTRALIAAATGAYRTGEKTLARQLLPRLGPGMPLLADANFACYELWAIAAATGAHLLWRARAPPRPPGREGRAGGPPPSGVKAPRPLRRQGAAGHTRAASEYPLRGGPGESRAPRTPTAPRP